MNHSIPFPSFPKLLQLPLPTAWPKAGGLPLPLPTAWPKAGGLPLPLPLPLPA